MYSAKNSLNKKFIKKQTIDVSTSFGENDKICDHKISSVELKYLNLIIESKIIDSLPFQFNRFSKYCRGIELTQKRQCDEII